MMMPIEAMAQESAQWYSIPRTHTASPSSLQQTAGLLEQPSFTSDGLPGPIAPFCSCFPYILDSNANNAAHSASFAFISANNCNSVDASATVIPSCQDSMQRCSDRAETSYADSMDCCDENPTANSISYALQLLGASRTSSCSNQTAWDDDEDDYATEGPLMASSQTCASITTTAAADHTISPGTPRPTSMARTCPAAPLRRGPSVKLVPACEMMGVF